MADEDTPIDAEPAVTPDPPAAEAPASPAAPKRVRKPRAPKAAAVEAAPAEPAPPPEEPSARAPRGVKPKRPAPAPKRAKTRSERGTYLRTPATPRPQRARRERRGVVVSAAGDKTITVRVDMTMAHPKYQKIMRHSVKLRAHDEQNQAQAGDTVRVAECRPVSKTKRWRLVEVVEVAK
jgi:small subunit ribosomal protein S17